MNPEKCLLLFAILPWILLPVAYRLGLRHRVRVKSWRKVWVSTKGRGTRADAFYWVPPDHDDEECRFSVEAVQAAKDRSKRDAHLPCAYED